MRLCVDFSTSLSAWTQFIGSYFYGMFGKVLWVWLSLASSNLDHDQCKLKIIEISKETDLLLRLSNDITIVNRKKILKKEYMF